MGEAEAARDSVSTVGQGGKVLILLGWGVDGKGLLRGTVVSGETYASSIS